MNCKKPESADLSTTMQEIIRSRKDGAVLIYPSTTGSFVAELLSIPVNFMRTGPYSHGKTVEEAVRNLHRSLFP